MAWSGESSGVFSVRSSYKLLQRDTTSPINLQTSAQYFYKRLWLLYLPAKVKIVLWRVANNFIPSRANLVRLKLLNDAMCPICWNGTENLEHIFLQCSITKEVWEVLNLHLIFLNREVQWIEWLTWVSGISSNHQFRVSCCALWVIWTERNKRIYENTARLTREITQFIFRYQAELDNLAQKKCSRVVQCNRWVPPRKAVSK